MYYLIFSQLFFRSSACRASNVGIKYTTSVSITQSLFQPNTTEMCSTVKFSVKRFKTERFISTFVIFVWTAKSMLAIIQYASFFKIYHHIRYSVQICYIFSYKLLRNDAHDSMSIYPGIINVLVKRTIIYGRNFFADSTHSLGIITLRAGSQ